MPYVPKRVIVEALVWEPFERPSLPSRPDWRPETGLPGTPEQPLPPEVGWPGLPDLPGIGGGPVLPGRPSLPPGWERPELPPRPSIPVYEVVEPGETGGHPSVEELDLNATRRIAVSDGDNVFAAYVIVSGDSEEPRHPERGLPGSWVTVAYHGTVSWAWAPQLTMPERPEMPPRPGRPEPR